jgi:hypothetical protein
MRFSELYIKTTATERLRPLTSGLLSELDPRLSGQKKPESEDVAMMPPSDL